MSFFREANYCTGKEISDFIILYLEENSQILSKKDIVDCYCKQKSIIKDDVRYYDYQNDRPGKC